MVSSSLALRPSLLPGETPDAAAESGIEAGAADTGVAREGGEALVGIEGVMEGMKIGGSESRAEA